MKYSKELAKVEKKLKEAKEILAALRVHAQSVRAYPMAGSLGRFESDISEILECDHGEAGLVPFIQLIKKGE